MFKPSHSTRVHPTQTRIATHTCTHMAGHSTRSLKPRNCKPGTHNQHLQLSRAATHPSLLRCAADDNQPGPPDMLGASGGGPSRVPADLPHALQSVTTSTYTKTYELCEVVARRCIPSIAPARRLPASLVCSVHSAVYRMAERSEFSQKSSTE